LPIVTTQKADHQPVKQHPDGHALFYTWRRMGLGELLDVGCHMHRLDETEVCQTERSHQLKKSATPLA
jgi:hypothetical protein